MGTAIGVSNAKVARVDFKFGTVLTYKYGARNFQVVINGYTGTIAGNYLKSWIKITFAVLADLAAVGFFLLLANR